MGQKIGDWKFGNKEKDRKIVLFMAYDVVLLIIREAAWIFLKKDKSPQFNETNQRFWFIFGISEHPKLITL